VQTSPRWWTSACSSLPITTLLIVIIYTMFKSFKMGVTDPGESCQGRIGGLLALLIAGTNFSVSSNVGFFALFGVSVQTGVNILEYLTNSEPLVDVRFGLEDNVPI
jgi:Cu/Ag efflux pump CusA